MKKTQFIKDIKNIKVPSDLQNEFQRFRMENGGGVIMNSNGVNYGPTYQQPSTQWQPASAY